MSGGGSLRVTVMEDQSKNRFDDPTIDQSGYSSNATKKIFAHSILLDLLANATVLK